MTSLIHQVLLIVITAFLMTNTEYRTLLTILQRQEISEPSGWLVIGENAGTHPQFQIQRSGVGPENLYFNKFPDEAATGPGTTF